MKQTGWTRLAVALALAVAGVACAETDAGITTKVKARLAADDTVKAYQIDVDTREKVVTLKGTVETEAARTQAVRLARETEGVARVEDNVIVNPTNAGVPTGDAERAAGNASAAAVDAAEKAAAATSDATITASVKAKLLADPDTAGLKIDVDTTNAVVTLTGTVKSAAEKTEAVKLARETSGVNSVIDRLTIGS
jgi:osmotically-inducible protein OsmY